jgi:HEAT repeat protein
MIRTSHLAPVPAEPAARTRAPLALAALSALPALPALLALLACLLLATPSTRALQDDGDAAGNALGYLGGRAAQDAAPPAAPGDTAGDTAGGAVPGEAAGLPPVEPPPALSAVDTEKVKRAVTKLRNDSDKHRHAAEADVVAFGRGAIPYLLDASTTDHAAMQDAILNCLAAVVDLRDRELVAGQLASERALLRRFAARAAGQLALPPLLDGLPPLLSDPDGIVRLEAALSLVANGREAGLGVATLAFTGPDKERVIVALAGVAGKGDHGPVAALLVIDPKREKRDPDGASKERLAAVQILHAIGDPAAVALLLRALDDKHNVVQRAAIDALRDILEGKQPLETSSIFQQLNEVKRLKEVVVKGG